MGRHQPREKLEIAYFSEGMKQPLLFVFLALLICSCASVTVRTDFDADAPFKDYKTYQLQTDSVTGLSELDERRLYRILDSVLQAQGWRKKPLPDILIDVRSEIYQAAPNSASVGVGGTGGQIGGGMQVGIPLNQNSLRRQITFLFVEFRSNLIVWEARAQGPFSEYWNPAKREKELRKVVLKTLERFPFSE